MSTRILVVEDNPSLGAQIGDLLDRAGFEAEHVRGAVEGLAAVDWFGPEAIVVDLASPGGDRPGLIDAILDRHPWIPIVLIAGDGGEAAVARALQEGATSFVPLGSLGFDIVPTLRKVLEAASIGRPQHRNLRCWVGSESRYVLENDPGLITSLIAHLAENLARMRMCDPAGLIRVNLALGEALNNAMFHGNLEVDSALREGDDRRYYALAEVRRNEPPYRDRRVHVIEREMPSQVVYVIRDEGPGFATSDLPDPTDPTTLERASGRGLLLIRTFMDEVCHNATGNEITLIKASSTLKISIMVIGRPSGAR